MHVLGYQEPKATSNLRNKYYEIIISVNKEQKRTEYLPITVCPIEEYQSTFINNSANTS